jgi:hypothetical protein
MCFKKKFVHSEQNACIPRGVNIKVCIFLVKIKKMCILKKNVNTKLASEDLCEGLGTR